MVFSLTAPSEPGVLGWVVFRLVGGAWQLVKPETGDLGAELSAVRGIS
jgi:hypothetical protein